TGQKFQEYGCQLVPKNPWRKPRLLRHARNAVRSSLCAVPVGRKGSVRGPVATHFITGSAGRRITRLERLTTRLPSTETARSVSGGGTGRPLMRPRHEQASKEKRAFSL